MTNQTDASTPLICSDERHAAKVAALENRLRLAHQARRAKEHQLDDIRRALCDAEIIKDDDPYSHADLADVVRSLGPAAEDETARKLSESELLGHRMLQRAERAEEELTAARAQLTRSENARDALRTRLERADDRAEAASVVGTRYMTVAEQAEAAIERVRVLVAGAAHTTSAGINDYDIGRHDMARAVLDLINQTASDPGEAATKATDRRAPALRDQIANAIARTNLPVMWPEAVRYEAADAVLAVVLPHTQMTAALHRSAEGTVTRVIDLYEQWVKAGPPPLGTSVSRWWDARLAELHNAIQPPADQTTEK